MILLLNGAFGIGKTTVARILAERLPRAVVFDPERIGIPLQRITRVDDFQDLWLWRRLTVIALRMTRALFPNVIVPMAFSNLAYLDEIRNGLQRFEPRVFHFCLVAPIDVVNARLRARGGSGAWEDRRAAECCLAHQGPEFATHVTANGRTPDDVAQEILRELSRGTTRPAARH